MGGREETVRTINRNLEKDCCKERDKREKEKEGGEEREREREGEEQLIRNNWKFLVFVELHFSHLNELPSFNLIIKHSPVSCTNTQFQRLSSIVDIKVFLHSIITYPSKTHERGNR